MQENTTPNFANHLSSSPPPLIIGATDLGQLLYDLFAALDVALDDVQIVVDALMEATLAGYDSHGVMRVPRYVRELRQGVMQARGEFKILHETAASAQVDGGRAMGAVTATRALSLACDKAAAVGVGVVTTTNSTDIGRLGSYLLKPAQAGFVTLLLVNDSGGLPTVAPFGGAARFFSTNPLGAGIPRRNAEPIIIDLSTSMASVGKLRMAAQQGATVPAGWLVDPQGETVVDPARFFAEPETVFLLPLGGLLAGYKGFALQLLVDTLAGALGGAGVATGVDPGIEANALFALALDPAHFAGRAIFLELVEQMVAGLEAVPSLPNSEGVRIPGQRAAQERQRRLATGIVLNGALQVELATLLTELGLAERYYGVLNPRSKLSLTTPSDREIVITRIFDAPRALVFQMMTDPALIPQWWGPRGFTTIVDKMEVKPGGLWRYIQQGPGGYESAFRGVYREVTPPERVVSTFEWEGMPGHVLVETIVFEDLGDKTRVTNTSLFHTAEERDGMLQSGMESGARETWDRLTALLVETVR